MTDIKLLTLSEKLPYNIKVKNNKSNRNQTLTVSNIKNYKDFTPHLRGLGQLIQPIIEGDKIPMIELVIIAIDKKKAIKDEDYYKDYILEDEEEFLVYRRGVLSFFLNKANLYFAVMIGNMMLEVENYSIILDKLHEWHFDTRNKFEERIELNELIKE